MVSLYSLLHGDSWILLTAACPHTSALLYLAIACYRSTDSVLRVLGLGQPMQCTPSHNPKDTVCKLPRRLRCDGSAVPVEALISCFIFVGFQW